MSDRKFKLSFNGKEIINKKFEEEEINEYFMIDQSYNLSSDRSDSLKHNVELTDKEIVQIRTDDGLEWIGLADDMPEIYGSESNSNRSDGIESFHMIPDIKQRKGSQRSGTGSIKNSVLDIIVSKGAKITAKKLAKMVDEKKCTNPGFFKVGKNRKTGSKGTIPSDKLCLLLIHGTISSYEDGFANIDTKLWNKMMDLYDGNVYAFNHKTISVSPIENAFDLIDELPENCTFDIISHSRGGLVADIMARCDFRNDLVGFSDEDINLIQTEFDHENKSSLSNERSRIAQLMQDLNKKARNKKLKINKIVRVACPAAGTTLLSKRMDHFLNAILSLLGLAVGSKLNPVYQYFKLFVLKVVEEKSSPESFPGLWSMVPDSTFQIINNRNVKISSHLVSIAGDSKVGNGILHSLKVILTNLYYWRENDFVVNTASMTKGLQNRRSNVFYKIQNKKIDHFSYFKIEGHMKIVLSALNNKSIENVEWKNIQRSYNKRGIVLKLADMGVLKPKVESGNRPIVILVPGIMGSNIYYKNDRKWLDFNEINKGALGKTLDKDNYQDTSAKSVIEKYYKDFHDHLIGKNHDVVVHPFDWRKSMTECVDDFNDMMDRALSHGQPVRIVAHSMGGLLVRQWKIKKAAGWTKFKNTQGAKFIMLGTPWKGSHLILEVLAGDSKRVKQLHLLDFKHNKRQLLDSLVWHKGIFELLPISDKSLDSTKTWNEVYKAAGKRNMSPIPAEQLHHYNTFRQEVSEHLVIDDEDKEIIFYVAGKNKKTIFDYEIKRSFFKGEHVKYKYTPDGDGSVTWATGIPEGLDPNHLFYVDVEHGNLANEETIFEGLFDLIVSGQTIENAFSKNKLRGGLTLSPNNKSLAVELSFLEEEDILDTDPLDNIFGINTYKTKVEEEKTVIHVEVFNGDLKWAKYPIMVGHFNHDGIVSAERAIDKYLDYKLTERHLMGFYPGKIGEQEIIYDHQNSPIGAIVIGLGEKDNLTGFRLTESVKKAMLKYAVFFRDNRMDMDNEEVSTSISTLIVGSNYGRLLMKESVRSILLGIQDANKIIGRFKTLKKITNVEFVDYYEDNAYECYKILQEIQDEKNLVDISMKDDLVVGYRNKRRLLRDESRSWWQSFSTELKSETNKHGTKKEYLDFGTYNGQASASKDRVDVDMTLARYIADQLSTVQEWDKVSSKVIFEMLLPNRYKDFIRNHRNIEWRLNLAAATFPWEMFHDFKFGDKPTFIESGLIRQLYSTDANIRPALVRHNTALVIANPIFNKEEGLSQLPGAKVEGEVVAKILDESAFKVTAKIEKEPLEIIKSLFSGEFKVLHIASHGLYNFEEGKVGIAIGDGQILTPGTIDQLSAIPEFVFINCCFSGTIVPEDEDYTKGRNSLAANVGTQLIEMGVKAVVAAGWAVHDGAAEIFAKVLYEELLDGAYFGDAAKKARYECYSEFPGYNTWGAYQCYGDQFYRLNMVNKSYNDDEHLTLEKEIVLELDNVLSNAKSLEIAKNNHKNVDYIGSRMQTLVQRAEALGKYTSEIVQREASILTYLGKYTQAVRKYKELFELDEGSYTVESLDIYCNIRAKNLVSCREDHCRVTDDSIEKVLKDMNRIELVGKGSRRLSTMGSTYKRAAMLGQDKREIRAHLETSADLYRRAALPLGIDNRAAIYQVSSFITIASFANSGLSRKNRKINIRSVLGSSIEEYLEKWLDTVDKDTSDRTNIYDQLAKIQLRMVSIIVGYGDRKEISKEILELYDRQISRCINFKDLIAEVEWIEFQIFMCEEFHEEFKKCIPFYHKLKRSLEPYYRHPNKNA